MNHVEIALFSSSCSALLWIKMLMFIVDLQNSDHASKSFLCKINCARFALARTDSIRSVSESLLAKPPYRRSSSVPMLLLAQCAVPHDSGMFMMMCTVSCMSAVNFTRFILKTPALSRFCCCHSCHCLSFF